VKTILIFGIFILATFGGTVLAAESGSPDPCIAAETCRPFQMSLFVYDDDPVPPATDTDIPMFTERDPQPSGYSILNFSNRATNFSAGALQDYDWSRILAFLFDEPYWTELADGNTSNPCSNPQRMAKIAEVRAAMKNAATSLRQLGRRTRIWINFSEPEVTWMMSAAPCGIELNIPEADVISMDRYWVPFSAIRHYYDWMWTNRVAPHQQLALVPGTHYRSDLNNPNQMASYLSGYFAYATEMNQVCNLEFGPTRITGSYDGCPIWLIAGWSAKSHYVEGGITYFGEPHPNSIAIANVWRAEVSVPQIPTRAAPESGAAYRVPVSVILKLLKE
jgi:hypothetical protein